MTTKERIIRIRLLEKMGKYPQWAMRLGLEASGLKKLDHKEITQGASLR